MSNERPKLLVDWYPFELGTLKEKLQLQVPPFSDAERAFQQLRYVERYAGAKELGCQSLAIESHYIDRDYMEDHSVFYSKSLRPYPNFCRRIHFFSITETEVKQQLAAIVQVGVREGDEEYMAQYLAKLYRCPLVIKLAT